MDYNLQLTGALAMYIDQSPALKLDFGLRCDELEDAIKDHETLYEQVGVEIADYKKALEVFRNAGEAFTQKADEINNKFNQAVKAGKDTNAINGGIEYTAYSFSNETTEELLNTSFCEYVKDNRAYGRKIARVNVYEATHRIVSRTNSEGFKEELNIYQSERDKLVPLLKQYMDQEIKGMDELTNMLFVK